MNMGKFNKVKDEMCWLQVDILGTSKLKWAGIGHFQSEDYTFYCSGDKKRKGREDVAFVAFIVRKGYSKDSTW